MLLRLLRMRSQATPFSWDQDHLSLLLLQSGVLRFLAFAKQRPGCKCHLCYVAATGPGHLVHPFVPQISPRLLLCVRPQGPVPMRSLL